MFFAKLHLYMFLSSLALAQAAPSRSYTPASSHWSKEEVLALISVLVAITGIFMR
jgi:hypothetical protein